MLEYSPNKSENGYNLLLFSFFVMVLTYGYALTNFTITVDNEMPILPDFGLDLGRWGQNFVRYHVFHGYLPYFSLVLTLFLFSVAAVRLVRIFDLSGLSAYMFCGLFLTFPQLAYQIVFSIMADVAALGVLLSTVFIELFLKGLRQITLGRKLAFFAAVSVLLMFMLSIYQAFILIPVSIYVLLFLKSTYKDDFDFKLEIKHMLILAVICITGAVLYMISVKLICPQIQDSGYLASFVSGDSENQFLNFLSIWLKNLVGSWYYGERMFLVSVLMSLGLLVLVAIERKRVAVRAFTILTALLLPFVLSAFITNNYHPPRLYLTSNLVFAFLTVFTLEKFKATSWKLTRLAVLTIIVVNIYFITNLFYSADNIFTVDKRTAEKIDNIIQNKFPEFNAGDHTVYFYGYFPYEYHQHLRLPDSEIFSGSFFNWDNGSNYRIINFIKMAGIADYRMVDSQRELDKVIDSISTMPKWPDVNSVKMINGVVVVKLGDEKGSKLYFE